MRWTVPRELRGQLSRLWDRGELLREAVGGATRFPLRLSLRAPGSADITDRFEAVRAWANELAAAPHLRLEWQEIRHRVQGTQRLPAAAWIDAAEDAVAWIGKRRDWDCFRALVTATRETRPALVPWLQRRPLQALELAEAWSRLLAVVDWVAAHPRPGIYLRQVDVSGVHSKFIEMHRTVLAELLDLVLPPQAVDGSATGAANFARRYGFLDKPVRIRFRLLDAALPSLPGCQGLPELGLDATNFAALALPVEQVFITENEINFLAFPPSPRAIVVFGAGYGWEAVAQAAWMQRCDVRYWGDIDTHGFAILDQLRSHFPQAASFLMDRETLLAHRLQWGEEPEPARHELARLSAEEAALYDELRFDRLQPRLRLEQERLGFGWVRQRLGRPRSGD